ncbi:MAG: SIMPL domain-containing protein [Candidatus Ryanbacteria bacterium]|nr:SIMPL domain-containing protein [Candidatus Ryanbacteria bacterium]
MDQEERYTNLILRPNPPMLVNIALGALIIFLGVKAYVDFRSVRGIVPRNSISVSGEGKVFVKPDLGQVTLTVFRDEPTVEAAQKKATEVGNRIVEFLKSKNIEEKDYKTTNYSIYPNYDYIENRGQVLRGYRVSQTYEVKIRDLAKAGEILSGAANAGANQVSDLRFTTEDPNALKEKAREMAIADAKAKAQKLASQLGVRLGDLVSFGESGGGIPPPIFYKEMAGGRGGDTIPVPEIPTGENEITVSVSLTYEIR